MGLGCGPTRPPERVIRRPGATLAARLAKASGARADLGSRLATRGARQQRAQQRGIVCGGRGGSKRASAALAQVVGGNVNEARQGRLAVLRSARLYLVTDERVPPATRREVVARAL